MDTVQPKIKLVMTAVYDSKVKQHSSNSFQCFRTIEEAIRSFGAAAKKEGHDFQMFASDYTLWLLGHFYPETGEIEKVSRMQIASATEFANS